MTSRNENRFLVFTRRFLEKGSGVHVVVLALAGSLVYLSSVFHPFVHDDVVFILQNPHIARWDNIADAFFRPSIPLIFEGLVTPYYRPVLEVLYRLQYALFGFDPHGFHLVNVLMHIANAVLVYGLISVILKNRAFAFGAALIFLVHPVQTQAVACVSGISNLSCAFFLLAAFNAYIRASQSQQEGRRFWLLNLAVAGFVLALFSKEQAVVFPFICAAYEILNRSKGRAFSGGWRLAAVLLPLLVYLVIRQTLFGSFASAIFENTGELKLRLLAIPGTLAMYTGLILWPAGLHYYRSVDILSPFLPGVILCALAVVCLWALIRTFTDENRKRACFGLFWFLFALAPVLNIIPLVNEYSFVAAAEHNLYFPVIGFLIFSCVAADHFASIWPSTYRERWVWFFVVLALIMGIATSLQNRVWKSEITLFQRTLQYQPQLGRVRILLAKAYFKEGRMDEAIAEFALAGEIMGRYAQKAATAKSKHFYNGMLKGIFADSAQAYAFKQDFRSSLLQYDKALALDPEDSHIYSNRALSLIGLGDIDSGMKDLEKASAFDPDNLLAANNLSICYIQKGDTAKARELLRRILAKDPGFKAARDNLDQLDRSHDQK
jgi:tetratricopeptide (TPR) repeat protein